MQSGGLGVAGEGIGFTGALNSVVWGDKQVGNMKLRTAFVLATFVVAGNAAELTIGSGTLSAPSQPAILNVALASGGASLTGIQFDLEYDAASLNVTVAAGPAVGSAGKNLQSAVIQPGKQRILIVGMNQSAIADGVVAVLQVSLKGRPTGAKTFTIHMSGPAGTNAQAQPVGVSGSDGSVKVDVR